MLNGLGAPRGMFISPDGQWIGFSDGLVSEEGGDHRRAAGDDRIARRLCRAGPRGEPDGTIVFATGTRGTGLQRVSAAGGEPTTLTTPDRARDERDHLWPEFLPDGQAVLFTIFLVSGGVEDSQIAVLDLQTGMSKVLIRGGSDARYVPTGHLVYGIAGTLRAVAFDLRRLEVTGTPSPVLEDVATTEEELLRSR